MPISVIKERYKVIICLAIELSEQLNSYAKGYHHVQSLYDGVYVITILERDFTFKE